MQALFDTHAHLDGDLGEVTDSLLRARAVGVTRVLAVGASHDLLPNHHAIEVATMFENVWASVAIHPHDADKLTPDWRDEIARLAHHPKVVAIGETGLDYHYAHASRSAQEQAFRAFLSLARDVKKPVVIHTREAEDDTLAILKSEHAEDIGGIFHCFTGSDRLAHAAIDLGFFVSFSGVITFKNADTLRQTLKTLPQDRVLLETDCPYLSPVPRRGEKNEPAFLAYTARQLAGLWEIDEADVRRITTENALRAFGIATRPLADAPNTR